MKKKLCLILSCALLVSLFAGCGSGAGTTSAPAASGEASASGDVVKIGVFEPASGKNGAGGKQEALGMQYANTVQPTVEIGGKTYQVQLVSADNQSTEDKAPSAAQTLVDAGVSCVLGSYEIGRAHV